MKGRKHAAAGRRQKVTEETILRDLKSIGVEKGDHLGVALSFKSIGYVVGGPQSFINALLKAVGTEGTVMMPTYTRLYPRARYELIPETAKYRWNFIFNPKSTPTYTGLVPETLRRQPEAIRSRHPSASVSAIGRCARYLTEDHDENASSYLPYSKLARIKGKVLIIGIRDRLVGIRHEAQNLAGLLRVVPIKTCIKYRDHEGKIKVFINQEAGGCLKKLHTLVPLLRETGLIKDGHIGMADAILAPARENLEFMTRILKDNPALNLCDDTWCLWCRELERRMNLYGRIENPRYFQMNLPIRYMVSLVNSFRLKIHNCIPLRFMVSRLLCMTETIKKAVSP